MQVKESVGFEDGNYVYGGESKKVFVPNTTLALNIKSILKSSRDASPPRNLGKCYIYSWSQDRLIPA